MKIISNKTIFKARVECNHKMHKIMPQRFAMADRNIMHKKGLPKGSTPLSISPWQHLFTWDFAILPFLIEMLLHERAWWWRLRWLLGLPCWLAKVLPNVSAGWWQLRWLLGHELTCLLLHGCNSKWVWRRATEQQFLQFCTMLEPRWTTNLANYTQHRFRTVCRFETQHATRSRGYPN